MEDAGKKVQKKTKKLKEMSYLKKKGSPKNQSWKMARKNAMGGP